MSSACRMTYDLRSMSHCRGRGAHCSVECKMSSSEDDNILLLALIRRRRRRRVRGRRWWTHPYWTSYVDSSSQFLTTQQLETHPEKFQNYFRMEVNTFKKLCGVLTKKCTLGETNYRTTISIEERLKIYLR